MDSYFDRALSVVGSLLIASLFWWSGIFGSLMTWPEVIDYVAAKAIPLPMLAAAGATALEIVVPLGLFVRRLAPFATAVLAIYCLLTAVLFHDFWTMGGEDRAGQMIHFLKNMALAGALLVVTARRARY
jgi:putative oxidoreductase